MNVIYLLIDARYKLGLVAEQEIRTLMKKNSFIIFAIFF